MVKGHRKEKLFVEILAGKHTVVSDVLPRLGGTDLGPNPHQIAESALAACTSITLQMYADRHGWKLVSADVVVTIDKEGPESHITRQISLLGELSVEQKSTLMEIADKCPIHKLLTSQISISTTPA